MFREMRRFKQQLEQAECEKILKEAKRGVLAVLGDEGYPYAVPLDFFYEDGHIYLHGAMEGHKVDAMRACDKVSFCVLSEGVQEEGSWWYHFNSVICFGRARLVEDRAESDALLRKVGEKYYPSQEELERVMKSSASRVQMVDITIEHMTGKHVQEE